jgi:hypothetical protein
MQAQRYGEFFGIAKKVFGGGEKIMYVCSITKHKP